MTLDAAGLGNLCLQQAARQAVTEFVASNRALLQAGRTLDFGCGDSPYRAFCGDEYVGLEQGDVYPEGSFDAILITQVLQEILDPIQQIQTLRQMLKAGGHWIVTYNASWYEVERQDLWRFSACGMEHLLDAEVLKNEPLITVRFTGFRQHYCYGIVARKN